MDTEITLNNVNWLNRQDAIEAYRWYGRLSDEQRQAFVNAADYDQTDLISQMLYATVTFIRLVGSNDFDLAILQDLALRFVGKTFKENW